MKEYNIIVGLDGITLPMEHIVECESQMEADLLAYDIACMLYDDHAHLIVTKEEIRLNNPDYCEEDIDFLYQSAIDDIIFYSAIPV